MANINRRKSAFLQYKSHNTILTNLQRGNTVALIDSEVNINFHGRCGQGEITTEEATSQPNIDVIDENGFSPLHWACFYGQLNAVTILIKCGANTNKLAPDKVSPLLLASAGGYNEIVKILMKNGADVNHKDIMGNTALMFAAAGNHPHTCNELLLYKPNIMDRNETDDSAYSLAHENDAILAQCVLEKYILTMITKYIIELFLWIVNSQ